MAKLTALSHDWIHRFLQAYSDFANLPFRAKALSAGTVNTIYKIDFAALKKTVYLKVDEVGHLKRLQNEFDLLQRLKNHTRKLDFFSPYPLAQSSGKLTSALRQKRVYLLPEVPGESLTVKHLQPRHFFELGRKMRALHGVSATNKTFAHKWNLAALQKLYTSLKVQIEKKDSELAVLLQTTLKRLQSSNANTKSCWIHGDLFFDNLHWQNARLVGILDFEYAGFGNPLYDCAMTLLALAWSGQTLNKRLCAAFWRGYQPQMQSAAAWRTAFEHASLTIVLTRMMTFEFGALKDLRRGRRDYRDFLKRLTWSQAIDFKDFIKSF